MNSYPLLPGIVQRLNEVPVRLQGLYEIGHDGAYRLSHAGRQLATYRQMVAEAYPGSPAPPRKLVKLDRVGWSQLLAAAESSERAYFLRAAAVGQIQVQD